MRYLVSFSCGVPSACAAKIAVDRYGMDVVVYYCNTFKYEHPDNRRFFEDVEDWIGEPIKIISSKDYSDIKDVWDRTGWLVGPGGARCTVELKKIPRMNFQEPDDVHILGFTWDRREINRAKNFKKNNPELITEDILIDSRITREYCFKMIREAGINPPVMYALGYKNNNCIGCPKGNMGYWNLIRKTHPEVFTEMAIRERKMNVACCHTMKGKERIRVFLDELDPKRGNYEKEPSIECGIYCQGGK